VKVAICTPVSIGMQTIDNPSISPARRAIRASAQEVLEPLDIALANPFQLGRLDNLFPRSAADHLLGIKPQREVVGEPTRCWVGGCSSDRWTHLFMATTNTSAMISRSQKKGCARRACRPSLRARPRLIGIL